jgi:hypothetical protein
MGILRNGLLAAALVGLLAACDRRSKRSALPKSLAGLRLTKLIVNGVAQDNLTEPRYGPEFSGYDNIVGYYGPEERQVKVYLTRFSTPDQAGEMLDSRLKSLKAGLASEFQNHQGMERAGRKIHRIEGSGLVHFMFQQGSRNVWISSPPDLGEQALNEFIRLQQR